MQDIAGTEAWESLQLRTVQSRKEGWGVYQSAPSSLGCWALTFLHFWAVSWPIQGGAGRDRASVVWSGQHVGRADFVGWCQLEGAPNWWQQRWWQQSWAVQLRKWHEPSLGRLWGAGGAGVCGERGRWVGRSGVVHEQGLVRGISPSIRSLVNCKKEIRWCLLELIRITWSLSTGWYLGCWVRLR